MKPVDVKDNTYIDSMELHSNEKDPKFEVGDCVRISKHKNTFAKGCTPNWSEEVSVIKKSKSTFPWTYVINDLNDAIKLLQHVTKKSYKRLTNKNLG